MYLQTIQPPKRMARARSLARRVQEAKCLLISLINQLASKGKRKCAHSNRPQQLHVKDKSLHQPALPEVQGFNDGGQLSRSLRADRVGFIDKQMQNLYIRLDLKSTLSSVVTSSLILVARTMDSNRCRICYCIRCKIYSAISCDTL